MKIRLLLVHFVVIFLFTLCRYSDSFATPKKHTIFFGGSNGFHYVPDFLEVIVGDTIVWSGDFTMYGLQSTNIPSGAASFHADSVPTFSYVVTKQGEYDYQNPIYASIGMKGAIIVDTIKHGLTNEGREFYLGMLYPNLVQLGKANSFYMYSYALINSYYENDIAVSYFDQTGSPKTLVHYHIPEKGYLKLSLDINQMFMDSLVETGAYKSCHITSSRPITIEYLSVGTSASGSYLALPSISLGKKYVIASYNDKPGSGTYGLNVSGGGLFCIIGTENNTIIRITPASTTIGGHPGTLTGHGANGNPQPYIISLNKGECYQVRSNGYNAEDDISGSIVEATNPIAVISGHENSNLSNPDQFPDFMVEQMIPNEFWDSTGYISIPFVEASAPADEGHGDTYRIYCYDSIAANAHLNIGGISGGFELTAKKYYPIAEKFDISSPVEIFSTNGRKISVMQYDERNYNMSISDINPAPSMSTVVPRSRWKKNFWFTALDDGKDHHYLNVLSSHINEINISVSGQESKPLSSLTHLLHFANVSSADNSLVGDQYQLAIPSFSVPDFPFYLSSEYPFMVYFYGDWYTGNRGWNTEYAAPAGMQLNTGVAPSFVITIDSSNCTSWHFCVTDTSKEDPGIKSVMLIDDPDGVYFEPGEQLKNVSFDTTLTYMTNELRPQGVKDYCFDVNVLNPLQDAIAPVAIVDNLGNAVLLNLTKFAPPLELTTAPPTSSRADSIVFPVKKIGEQICTTFVFKNTAPKNGTVLNLSSALLTNNDTSYKVVSVTPALPHSLAAQDSLMVQVCYTPQDSSRHRDSLIMRTDCFSIAISLDAHGSTGLISASDLDFGSVTAGDTLCKNLQIKNVGSAPFTLTKSFALSDSINFTVDSSKLPIVIQPGGSVQISICFHPIGEGSYSGGVDWSTDLEASFAHSVKSHSVLSGSGTPKASVKDSGSEGFSIRPNPAHDRIVVSLGTGGLGVRPTELMMFDVLGREVYHRDILSGVSQIEIPVRGLSEGVYFVQVGSVTQRVVVSH